MKLSSTMVGRGKSSIRTDLVAALGSPLFMVKARIQAYSPALPVGAQHYYKGSFDALRTILKSDGILGLWRGVNAAILRTAMASFSARLSCHVLARGQFS